MARGGRGRTRARGVPAGLPALLAIAALAFAVFVAHGVGYARPGVAWGANANAYLSPALALAARAITIAAAFGVWLAAHPERAPAWLAALARPRAWAVALAAAAAFALARSATLLLGDGLPVTATALHGGPLTPYEPLASLWQRAWVLGAERLGAKAGFETAWHALALASIAAGAAFAACAAWLARELCLDDGAPALPTTLLLLSQGYVELFCGYVENYAIALASAATFLALGVAAARGRRTFVAASAMLVLAVLVHFAALALTPAWLVLAALEWRRRGARGVWPGVVAALVALGLGALLLARLGAPLPHGFARLASDLETGPAQPRSLGDFINEQLLAGPIAAAFAGVALAFALLRGRRDGVLAFAIAAAAGALAVMAAVGPANLGYARNWDLPAAWAMPLTLVTAVAIVRIPAARAMRAGMLAVCVGISLWHTLPWLAVNAGETASEARFAALPLPAGSALTTLGYWHALRGRAEQAEREWNAAIAAHPDNVRAWLLLARLQATRGDRRAAAATLVRGAYAVPADPRLLAAACDAELAAGDTTTALRLADARAREPGARALANALRSAAASPAEFQAQWAAALRDAGLPGGLASAATPP